MYSCASARHGRDIPECGRPTELWTTAAKTSWPLASSAILCFGDQSRDVLRASPGGLGGVFLLPLTRFCGELVKGSAGANAGQERNVWIIRKRPQLLRSRAFSLSPIEGSVENCCRPCRQLALPATSWCVVDHNKDGSCAPSGLTPSAGLFVLRLLRKPGAASKKGPPFLFAPRLNCVRAPQ